MGIVSLTAGQCLQVLHDDPQQLCNTNSFFTSTLSSFFFFFVALCRHLARDSLTAVAGMSRSDAAASIATYWQRRVTAAEGAAKPNFGKS